MNEISDCGGSYARTTTTVTTTPAVAKFIYRYNPGVSSNVPTPPTQNPNSLGIVPDDLNAPAMCYPISTDGSGQTYTWNIESGSWK